MVQPLLARVARRGLRQVLRPQLARLRRSGVSSAEVIARSIEDALRFRLDAEERRWVADIERRRRHLLSSEQTIDVIDFGAGSGDVNRTAREQEAGHRVKLKVAKVASASKPRFWAFWLMKLCEGLRPRAVIELGTCVGISAAYQGAALRRAGQGHLWTLEGSPAVAGLARETATELGLEEVEVVEGRFVDTLDTVLEAARPIDLAFVDGHHDEKATVRYFERLQSELAPDAVVVFDDIRWSPGMSRAFDQVCDASGVRLTVDLGPVGLCAMGPGRGTTRLRIPLR